MEEHIYQAWEMGQTKFFQSMSLRAVVLGPEYHLRYELLFQLFRDCPFTLALLKVLMSIAEKNKIMFNFVLFSVPHSYFTM